MRPYKSHDASNVTTLPSDQVFVFGSNQNGKHKGGASLTAKTHFGAVEGMASGRQGNSYAVPLLGADFKKIGFSAYIKEIIAFKKYAKAHPNVEFFLTEIGCGYSGYSIDEIAPYFNRSPSNVIFPQSFMPFIFDASTKTTKSPDSRVLAVLMDDVWPSMPPYKALQDNTALSQETKNLIMWLNCVDLARAERWLRTNDGQAVYQATRSFIHYPTNSEYPAMVMYLLHLLCKLYGISPRQLMTIWKLKPHGIPVGF